MRREEGPLLQTLGIDDAERPFRGKKSLTAARDYFPQKEPNLHEF